jgi:hypothetical protein
MIGRLLDYKLFTDCSFVEKRTCFCCLLILLCMPDSDDTYELIREHPYDYTCLLWRYNASIDGYDTSPYRRISTSNQIFHFQLVQNHRAQPYNYNHRTTRHLQQSEQLWFPARIKMPPLLYWLNICHSKSSIIEPINLDRCVGLCFRSLHMHCRCNFVRFRLLLSLKR